MARLPQPPPWRDERLHSLGGGAPFVACRAVNLHGCAPASRGSFPQIPAFECRCIRSGCVARPHRTAVGTPRSGALPEAAHRPSWCTASSETAPWTPASLCAPHPAAVAPTTGDPGRCGGFHEAACGARVEYPRRAGFDPAGGTGSERAQGRERSRVEFPASQGPCGVVRDLFLRELRPDAPTHMAETARFPRREDGC
jgi:hypothetical protein